MLIFLRGGRIHYTDREGLVESIVEEYIQHLCL